ncbi:adenylosuccinate synthetase [Mesorhizobium sp. M0847]|uniref:adenylosuccinate synthetase n=1 Tax=unclassified Mesorhizobium TaxID=325217 RepID=UPI00333DFD23
MRVLLALSGPVGVGKSKFCEILKKRFAADCLSTRDLLIASGAKSEREDLQAAGERLDQETDGKWVSDALAAHLSDDGPSVVIIDAIRIKKQIDHIRQAFGDRFRVWHVFLDASDEILEDRYANRKKKIAEFATYGELKASPTEARIRLLKGVVDRAVDTSRCEPASAVAQAVAGLGLYPLQPERLVDVVVGGQYGSEGKGHMCAYLARDYDLLIRVGGPNAGHKVRHPEYTYVQLPSGTQSNPNAGILIGAGATISLPVIFKEIKDLKLNPDRLSIDGRAVIIEPSDIEYEERSMDAIGSTKKGVGVATARKILGRDKEIHLGAKVRLARDISDLQPFIVDGGEVLERAYAKGKRICLEGTQGTDLSLHHADYPYVTSRETTASGCLADAGIAPGRVRKIVMVTRTYPIRVGGTSGEMARPIEAQIIADRSDLPVEKIQKTEVGTVSGKKRRIAEFDWEQVRRTAVINGATDIALSFSDYISELNQRARSYQQLTTETRDFIEGVERVANAPVSLISTRFEARGIIDRRNWK